jgi:glycosyltransferase involved in cell wall biosynthesis
MMTVLLATRNGSCILPNSLEAFAGLEAPASGWKLVVADNGSTDSTPKIISSFQTRLPLTYVHEARPGKNAALNTALGYLEGDLAVFTDDDVFPRSDWLLRLRAAADSHPSYDIFGGVILPRWETPPPDWVALVPPGPFFAITAPGLTEGPTEPASSVFGPNMAIRAEIFRSGVRFDEKIGPRGASYAMGSETELVLRLGRQGHKAWHVHEAVVEHFVRDYQLKKSWIYGRSVKRGRGTFRLSQLQSPPALPPWPKIAFEASLRIARRLLRIILACLTANEKALFVARQELNYNWGVIMEAHLLSREPMLNASQQGGNR